jgi:hypothetical protein
MDYVQPPIRVAPVKEFIPINRVKLQLPAYLVTGNCIA